MSQNINKRTAKRFLLDIFFPNRCPFCDGFITWDSFCCKICEGKLPLTGGELCGKCGKEPCVCGNELFYDGCYTACYYEGGAASAIVGLKTKNALNAAEVFGGILVEKLAEYARGKPAVIVPVPMTKGKQASRGYNQAEEIARVLSERTGIPLKTDLLFKNESTAQHTLSAIERAENVRNEFRGSEKRLDGRMVLLCDDVMTTGSTINECAKILKGMGAELVLAAVCTTTRLKKPRVLL